MADLSRGLPNQAPLLLMEPPLPDLRHGVIGRNQQALGWLSAWMSSAPPDVSSSAPNTASAGIQDPSSLLLWGATGAGKSFWLQAWALKQAGQRVYDLHDTTQARAFLDAVQYPDPPRVWLIDNIDRASTEVQQALFALFIAIQQTYGSRSQRLVATARAAPAQLVDQLREDLRALGLAHPASATAEPLLTVSIGLAAYSPGRPYLSPQALMQAADEALYIAKHAGRDRLSLSA